MAGLIAIFLVFRYQVLDDRVDNRKARIRSLLKFQIRNNPSIDVKIQNIRKEKCEEQEVNIFRGFNYKGINEKVAKEAKDAVTEYIHHIYAYGKSRDLIVGLGLASIVIWVILSAICLIGSCIFSSIRCCAILNFVITGFMSSMAFTLYFVFIAILKKPG